MNKIVVQAAYNENWTWIKQGIDKFPKEMINTADEDNWTALCYAVAYYKFDIVKLLLKHKAEIDAGDNLLSVAWVNMDDYTKFEKMYKLLYSKELFNNMRFKDNHEAIHLIFTNIESFYDYIGS